MSDEQKNIWIRVEFRHGVDRFRGQRWINVERVVVGGDFVKRCLFGFSYYC